MPELSLRTNALKEHQIDDFRYIYARIQHIHGYSDMRLFTRNLKVINKALGITVIGNNALSKTAMILRIQLIKPFYDILSVSFILSENDRLPQPVTACYLNTLGH
ncbi:hypothetical protein D3C81_2070560 [compost metagenome]